MHDAVHASHPWGERLCVIAEVFADTGVELEYLDGLRKLHRRPLGHPPGSSVPGQHDLGARQLCLLGHRPRDAALRKDPRHQHNAYPPKRLRRHPVRHR